MTSPPSLRRQILIACVGAATVPALLLATPLAGRLTASLRRDAEAQQDAQAERLAGRLDLAIQLAGARIAAAAKDSDVRRASRVPIFVSKADQVLHALTEEEPLVASLIALGAAGTVVTAQPPGLELRVPPAAQEALRAMVAGLAAPPPGSTFIARDGEGLAAWSTAPALALIVPVHAGTGPSGSLVALLPWQRLLASLAAEAGGSRAAAPDRAADAGDGRAERRPPWPGMAAQLRLGSSQRLLAGAAARQDRGTLRAATAPLRVLSGATLTLLVPERELYAAADTARATLGAAAAAGLFLLALVAFQLARRLVRPLMTLETFIAEVAGGNYRALAPAGIPGEFQATVALVSSLGARVLADLEATERRAAAETAQAQSELEALKAQLRPHFLFNALNGIAALAHERAADAAPMLTKLAELYRLILAAGRQALQPLGVELKIVRDYLELERLRLGERLAFHIDTAGVDEHALVPGLLLQTLAENAIKHGVAPALAGGRIALTVRATAKGGLAVRIANTGEPLAKTIKEGTGLATTLRRLELLAPGLHGFSLTTVAGEQGEPETVASFTLPRLAKAGPT